MVTVKHQSLHDETVAGPSQLERAQEPTHHTGSMALLRSQRGPDEDFVDRATSSPAQSILMAGANQHILDAIVNSINELRVSIERIEGSRNSSSVTERPSHYPPQLVGQLSISPKLSNANTYRSWADSVETIAMANNLRAYYYDENQHTSDPARGEQALSLVRMNVESSVSSELRQFGTAYEAWQHLKQKYDKKRYHHYVRVSTWFYEMDFSRFKSTDSFEAQIVKIRSTLAQAGSDFDELQWVTRVITAVRGMQEDLATELERHMDDPMTPDSQRTVAFVLDRIRQTLEMGSTERNPTPTTPFAASKAQNGISSDKTAADRVKKRADIICTLCKSPHTSVCWVKEPHRAPMKWVKANQSLIDEHRRQSSSKRRSHPLSRDPTVQPLSPPTPATLTPAATLSQSPAYEAPSAFNDFISSASVDSHSSGHRASLNGETHSVSNGLSSPPPIPAATLKTWHLRMAHCHVDGIKHLAKQGVIRILPQNGEDWKCTDCSFSSNGPESHVLDGMNFEGPTTDVLLPDVL